VVTSKSVAVKVVVVFTIGNHMAPSIDDSQRTIDPIFPLNVNTVLFVPEQTVAPPAIDPPTLAGLTVTITG
jgi:hypothetical protein